MKQDKSTRSILRKSIGAGLLLVIVAALTLEATSLVQYMYAQQSLGKVATLRAENEKLRLAADPGMQSFQRYFENFRGAYADMKSLIAGMAPDEKQRKLIGVLRKTLGAMAEEWS